MPEIATGAADGSGRRGWRPPLLHAGEVTKQKKPADAGDGTTTEEPPVKKGPKIGGAKNFLAEVAPTVTPDDSNDSSRALKDIAAVEHYTNSAIVTTDAPHDQRLAPKPIYRQYWSKLTYKQLEDWEDLPDIAISRFCNGCQDNQERSQCSGVKRHTTQSVDVKCRSCRIRQKNCLFGVSYWHFEDDEDDGLNDDRLPIHLMRELDCQWRSAQGTPLEVVELPESTPEPSHKPDEKSRSPAKMAPKKPLAEIRAAATDLAEILVKDSYSTTSKEAEQVAREKLAAESFLQTSVRTKDSESLRPYWEFVSHTIRYPEESVHPEPARPVAGPCARPPFSYSGPHPSTPDQPAPVTAVPLRINNMISSRREVSTS